MKLRLVGTIILMLIIIAGAAGVRAQGATNLIDNASFEDGLTGWQYDGSWVMDSDAAHGSYSLRLETLGMTRYIYQPISPNGENCSLSYQAKGDRTKAQIFRDDDAIATISTPGGDWQTYSTTFSVTQMQTLNSVFALKISYDGILGQSIRVDNVVVICTPAPDRTSPEPPPGPPDHCVTGYAALASGASTSETIVPGGFLYATGFNGSIRLDGYSDSGGGGVTYPTPKPRIHHDDVPSDAPFSRYLEWSRLGGSSSESRTWTFLGPHEGNDVLFFVNCAAEPDATPTPTETTDPSTPTPTEEPTPEYPGWWDACLVAEAVPRTFQYRAGWMPAGTYYVIDTPAIYPHTKMDWDDHYCGQYTTLNVPVTSDQGNFSVLTFDNNVSGWHMRVRSGHVSHAMTSGPGNSHCTGAGGHYQSVLLDPADGWKTIYHVGLVWFSPVPFRMEFCPPTVNINQTATPTATPTETEVPTLPTNWVTFTPTITPTIKPTPTATITGTGDYPSCPPLNCVSYDSYNVSPYPSTTAITMTNGDNFRICGADAYYGTESYLPGDAIYNWNRASQTINWWTVAEPARIDICRDIIPVPTPVPVPTAPTLPPGVTATPAGGGDDCFPCDICQILSDILITELRNLEDNRTAIALLETIAATATSVPTATPPNTATAIGELQTLVAIEQTRDAFPTPTETPQDANTPTPAGGSVPTIQCVTTTAILDSPFPTANLTALPDMHINIPTLRPIWTPVTTAFTTVQVLDGAATMIAQVQQPVSAISGTVVDGVYNWQTGTDLAETVTAPIDFSLLSILNPDSSDWEAEGSAMWAVAPLVRPFLPLIGLLFVFTSIKFTIAMIRLIGWFLEWVVRIIELIPGE